MISGKTKIDLKKLIEDKLSHLDLFSYYYPYKFELNKRCRNVLVSSDNNPSMVIYYRDGGVFFKCFNSPNKGNIWQFLMDYTGKNFEDVLKMVANDFGLLNNSSEKFEKKVREIQKIEKKESKPPIIKAEVYKTFPERHLNYLKQYTLTPEDMNCCSDTEVLPLKTFYINGIRFPVKKNEVGFVYLVDKKYIKIYLPERPKGEKWWSNIPFQKIHGLDNLKGCKVGFLIKSIKDASIIKKYISPCVGVIQAENISCISEENAEIIKNSVENLYIIMDNDPTGKQASYALCDLLNAKHINVPDKYFPQSTDFADMTKNEGVNLVLEHFRKKIKEL